MAGEFGESMSTIDHLDAIPLEDDLRESDLIFEEWTTRDTPIVPETEREILLFDGEAQGNDYNLLTCSNGNYLYNPQGSLGTEECFKFLCMQGEPSTLHFGFAFGYDINMMLVDLDKTQLARLARFKRVRWQNWFIDHIPGKRFGIRNIATGDYCTIWDLFPFVQCSFVKWIKEWELADVETVARIKRMKELRDVFDTQSFEDILKYCLEECTIGVIGARKLIGTCESVGIHLTSFYGAGSLASAMLKKHNIFNYLGKTPPEIEALADLAYFGGRSEISLIGRAKGPLHAFDINSAYPAGAAEAPCLVHGEWIADNAFDYIDKALPKFALCEVEWDLRERKELWFGPFPVRPKRGSIRYPLSGSGWYWSVEIDAARRMYPYQITIKNVHRFDPKCTHQPFSFVRYTYDERRALKKVGNFGHMPLKLGLNSLYGKCAQKIGAAPYRCLVWAGWITAFTRAKILDAVAQDPEAILSIATDGIVSKRELDLPVSGKLGEWEHKVISWIFIAQCGVYFYDDGTVNDEGEKITKKSRGFLAKELSMEMIEAELKAKGVLGKVEVSARRFIGYKSALKRKNWDEWRQWHDVAKQLRLRSEPRRRTIGGIERLPQLARCIGSVIIDKDFIRTIPPLDSSEFKPDKYDVEDRFVLDWNAELDMMLEQPTLFDGEPL